MVVLIAACETIMLRRIFCLFITGKNIS